MSGICYIAGSGDFTNRDFAPGRDDYVIAADGGYESLCAHGISANLLAGDFDSIREIPQNIEAVRFPAVKDDTDMGLAIQIGLRHGYRAFRLYGGSGSRPDHFYANLQLLARYASLGYDIRLVCPDFTVYALSRAGLTLSRERGCVFSVFAASDECRGVNIKNAKYCLENACVSSLFPLGVSNEFVSEPVEISVENGILLIFEYLSASVR